MNQQLKTYYQKVATKINPLASTEDLIGVLKENDRLSREHVGDQYDAYCRLSDRHIIYRYLKGRGLTLKKIHGALK